MNHPTRDTPPRALVEYYRLLRQHGLNDSHSGNASVGDARLFWITPRGCCADTLAEADLVACETGRALPAKASLDAALHRAIYESISDAAAVIHCHGPHAIALSMDGNDFVPEDFEGQYYFDRVPVLSIDYADYLAKAPAAVAAALSDSPVVMVRGHGIYARGEDLDQAYKWCASLESSARIAWLHHMLSERGTHA